MTVSDDKTPNNDSPEMQKPTLRLSLAPKKAGKAAGKNAGPFKKGGKPKPRSGQRHSGERTDHSQRNGNRGAAAQRKAHQKRPEPIPADARRLCLLLLTRLFEDGMHFDQAFNNLPGLDRLAPRDRGFIRHLASMILRHHGQLQQVIEMLIPKPPTGQPKFILMMGIAQLCILQTGAHAATNTTVDLMRQSNNENLAGLTNAVMRRLIREDMKSWADTDPLNNLPDHLYESWMEAYGEARCRTIMKQVQQVPPLDISAKSPTDCVETLSGKVLDGTIRTAFEGDITAMAGYADGTWWVQDIAAAMPARLIPDEAETIIDLCAAPGGKTAQLLAKGATVTAIEKDPKRAERLKRNLERLQYTPDLHIIDGLEFSPAAPVDAVLLDAPCSATGTIRRRPDILLREHHDTSRDTMSMLTELQLALAHRAANWLKPGGSLIYATCSLQPEEGEAIIEALLEARPDLSLSPIAPEETGQLASSITSEGWMRILPDCVSEGGNDGFFIARLQRYRT